MEKTKTPRRKTEKPPSWVVMRSIITCKNLQQEELLLQQPQEQHKKQKKQPKHQTSEENIKKCKKMKCSGSLCSNTKVMHRPETALTTTMLSTTSPEVVLHKKRGLINDGSSSSSRSIKVPLQEINGVVAVSSNSSSSNSLNFSSASNNSSSVGGSFRGNFRKFSGCYECRMVVDPVLGFTRDPSLRASICSCPDCGEIFMKAENLELHQAVRHAVSELGPDDTSKNIVEIIFQSSWLKKQVPVCKIDRILKVHNTHKTITKFEEYRDTIKSKATKLPKKHPRCIADGNELLRFHCTTFLCSIGLNGSSNLCNNIPHCNGCSIVRHGFKASSHDVAEKGILTTATSGKAHDSAGVMGDDEKRAMLVCRVIAGRVKKTNEGSLEEYDSVAGAVGVYSNLDELYVFNPRAILPCFVVIYRGF